MKSVRIRSYSGPHLPAFELNTERCISPYSVRMRENVGQNNFECGHFLRSDAILYTYNVYNDMKWMILVKKLFMYIY